MPNTHQRNGVDIRDSTEAMERLRRDEQMRKEYQHAFDIVSGGRIAPIAQLWAPAGRFRRWAPPSRGCSIPSLRGRGGAATVADPTTIRRREPAILVAHDRQGEGHDRGPFAFRAHADFAAVVLDHAPG